MNNDFCIPHRSFNFEAGGRTVRAYETTITIWTGSYFASFTNGRDKGHAHKGQTDRSNADVVATQNNQPTSLCWGGPICGLNPRINIYLRVYQCVCDMRCFCGAQIAMMHRGKEAEHTMWDENAARVLRSSERSSLRAVLFITLGCEDEELSEVRYIKRSLTVFSYHLPSSLSLITKQSENRAHNLKHTDRRNLQLTPLTSPSCSPPLPQPTSATIVCECLPNSSLACRLTCIALGDEVPLLRRKKTSGTIQILANVEVMFWSRLRGRFCERSVPPSDE